jgi:hypothetical protein
MRDLKNACKTSAAKKLSGMRKAYANGGAVMPYSNGGMIDDDADAFMDDAVDQARMVDGVPVRQRLDRPMAKPAKSTNITINVATPKAEAPAAPMVKPVVPPGIPPMAGPPPAPPMMPGAPAPGVPMRANGGRVYKESKSDSAEAMGTMVSRAIAGKEWRNQAQNSTTASKAGRDKIEGMKKAKIMKGQEGRNVTPSMGRANGGSVTPKEAVHKHEAAKHKGEAKTKFSDGGKVDDSGITNKMAKGEGAGGGLGRLEKAKVAKADK